MREAEVVLPRRAVAQPKPHHNPAGDCGACCLAGLFGLTVPEVYERLNRGVVEAFSWHPMRSALLTALVQGLADRVSTELPLWPVRYEAHQTWGHPAWMQLTGWRERLLMALDAGYYALAEVAYSRPGYGAPPDHVVLLAGMRTQEVQLHAGGSTYRTEVLVSCSASHPEGRWVDDSTFLREWGGFNLVLARPASGDTAR